MLSRLHSAAVLGVDAQELFNQVRIYDADLREVRGQEHVKRALEVAAAGGHNLLTLCMV